MFEKIAFHVRGITQHVQHNGQLADPANRYTIAMKKLTAKRAKDRTEADFQALDDLEWEGSLYLDHESRVVVPGDVIEGAYFEAGKKLSKGPVVRNGLQSPGNWRLIYDGPTDLKKLKADPEFRLRTMVRNPSTKARLARTRPIFRKWELKYELTYRSDMLGRETIIDLTKILFTDIGLSDDRKKMGGRAEILETS